MTVKCPTCKREEFAVEVVNGKIVYHCLWCNTRWYRNQLEGTIERELSLDNFGSRRTSGIYNMCADTECRGDKHRLKLACPFKCEKFRRMDKPGGWKAEYARRKT